jgi:hypothetical protein
MSNPDAFTLGRVGAMELRYTYLLRSSWPRILEMIYWPAAQMLTWGFLQTCLARAQVVAPTSAAIAAGALNGGVLLWDILLRGQEGFLFSFLEEIWSRNIPNTDEPAAARRIRRRPDGDEPHKTRRRRRSGHAHGHRIFRLQSLGAGHRFRGLFRGSDPLCLERRLAGFGHPVALWAGRGKSRLVADVHHSAARLRLLSCGGSARLATCRRPMYSRACAAC